MNTDDLVREVVVETLEWHQPHITVTRKYDALTNMQYVSMCGCGWESEAISSYDPNAALRARRRGWRHVYERLKKALDTQCQALTPDKG